MNFYKGENKVTLLARGKHYEAIKKNGMVINHIRQKQETIDKINVVNELKPEDEYDIIFVVVQKSQLNNVLPIVAQNTKCQTVIWVGNNMTAEQTYREFMSLSQTKPNVLFVFFSCGGHREDNIVYNWHGSTCEMTLGGIKGVQVNKELFRKHLKELVCKQNSDQI